MALQLWVPSVFIVVSVRCQPAVKCSRVSEAFRWSGEQQTNENIHEGNSLVMLYGAPSGKHTILVQYDNYDKPFEFEGKRDRQMHVSLAAAGGGIASQSAQKLPQFPPHAFQWGAATCTQSASGRPTPHDIREWNLARWL